MRIEMVFRLVLAKMLVGQSARRNHIGAAHAGTDNQTFMPLPLPISVRLFTSSATFWQSTSGVMQQRLGQAPPEGVRSKAKGFCQIISQTGKSPA
jgi:hypothetical protein